DRLLSRLPGVKALFERARPVHPFVHSPRVAFRSTAVVGRRWAMLPSAAGVIDPLLSTGFPLNLLGIARLLEVLADAWEDPRQEAALARYADETQAELDATERLVAALYATMPDFALFKKLALLYFAAASFSETVRRLGRPERARGFLLHEDPAFGPELRACCDTALGRPTGAVRERLLARIDAAVEPKDVAGLSDRGRRDHYPVHAGDLLAGAAKLGASRDEIEGLLARCGFVPGSGGRSAALLVE
ncbi:MAG TPA: hypothetical protein VLL75_06630, partial [Vicinamibacteria bacterium]|nr:hypothetical protein [Vicinamibacteria bacterium]